MNESTVEKVTRLPCNVGYEYIGPASITFENREFVNVAHVHIEDEKFSIECSVTPDSFDGVVQGEKRLVVLEVGVGERHEFGVLTPDRYFGIAESLKVDDSWKADSVHLSGVSPRFSNGLVERMIRGTTSELTEQFSRDNIEIAAIRFVFEGPFMEANTWYKDMRVWIRPCQLRLGENYQGIAVTIETRFILSEKDREAVWLWASFLAGRHLALRFEERYNDDGELLHRHRFLGIRGTLRRVPPIPYTTLSAKQAAIVGNGIRQMVTTNFPIEVVLDYLHTSADAYQVETEIALLLLAIHCITEAWARLPDGGRGKVNSTLTILSDLNRFRDVRDAMLVAMEPYLQTVPQTLANKLIQSISMSNNTGMRERLEAGFADLGIDASDAIYALKYRNKLFHNGYVFRSLDGMSVSQQQAHVDASARLRNIANAMILSLCGYSGLVVEFARNVTFEIRAKPSPFNDVPITGSPR
jgi:hypothetical protein